jgi:hypothetical protein
MNPRIESAHILQAHALYGRLTGQNLRLDYVRERQWYELLRAGFTLEDVRRVILYLQREIREGRRNVGALKLSNLLQPDRFEEDLHIRRVRLEAPARPAAHSVPPPLSPEERERRRTAALEHLRQIRETLG